MARISLFLFLFCIVVPVPGHAQDRSTPGYSKDEIDARIKDAIDAKINELRAAHDDQSVPRAELDAIKNLQMDMKRLMDNEQNLEGHVTRSITQALDDFNSELALVQATEATNQVTATAISRGLKDVEGSLSNPQSPPFLTAPSLGTIVSAIIGALSGAGVTGYILIYIARSYTGRLKMIESTFEFSKRFGELLQLQSELNNDYLNARKEEGTKCVPTTLVEINKARTWWWRFFDLMVYEYDFFKNGLLWNERYIEWMKWRWHDYNDKGSDAWSTCGIDYKLGWELWKARPGNVKNRMIKFFDTIHEFENMDQVEKYVESQSPPEPYRYHLVEGV
jgi:hypothetical protein